MIERELGAEKYRFCGGLGTKRGNNNLVSIFFDNIHIVDIFVIIIYDV
jgi:hypothetical protein